MKTPSAIAKKLRRQWENPNLREERLTSADAWPLSFPIGRPTNQEIEYQLDVIRQTVELWRTQKTGTVEWYEVTYRSVAQPIAIPTNWKLKCPSDWVIACEAQEVSDEYKRLTELCANTPEADHLIWLRKRHLWRAHQNTAVIQASQLADELSPGYANGRPLRALGLAGVDSKFFERHRSLMIELLNRRYDGAISDVGLEAFLNAAPENEHWLLLGDLDENLLPFSQQRVRASELAAAKTMPGTHLILVENERSLHQLPKRQGLLAVLGSGLNLNWLSAKWLEQKQIAYWGDIDTWGLKMLATARSYIPNLAVLLMSESIFDKYALTKAVEEPYPADLPSDATLSESEKYLFEKLRITKRGRLEQEFIHETDVHEATDNWL